LSFCEAGLLPDGLRFMLSTSQIRDFEPATHHVPGPNSHLVTPKHRHTLNIHKSTRNCLQQ